MNPPTAKSQAAKPKAEAGPSADPAVLGPRTEQQLEQEIKAQHLVLTRYAQKGLFYEDFSSQWLDDRLRIFRAYCAPSMAQQTADDFSWLIFCDESLDRDYLAAIEESAKAAPQLRLVATSHERHVGLTQAISPLIEEDTEVLITTRLDNDDGLHAEAIAVLQGYLPAFVKSPHQRLVVNFPRGYRYETETGRAYAAYWLHGPFMTLFEKLQPGKREFRNIYKVRHNWLHHTMPLHFDESIPGWLQVIHGLAESTEYRSGVPLTGGNRESQVKADVDIEIDPAEIETGFGVDLSERATFRSRRVASRAGLGGGVPRRPAPARGAACSQRRRRWSRSGWDRCGRGAPPSGSGWTDLSTLSRFRGVARSLARPHHGS